MPRRGVVIADLRISGGGTKHDGSLHRRRQSRPDIAGAPLPRPSESPLVRLRLRSELVLPRVLRRSEGRDQVRALLAAGVTFGAVFTVTDAAAIGA